MMKLVLALDLVAVAAAVLLVLVLRAPSGVSGYWSQFRCEGDCDEDSGCPYCCGAPVEGEGE